MPPLCVQSQCSSEGEGRDGGGDADGRAYRSRPSVGEEKEKGDKQQSGGGGSGLRQRSRRRSAQWPQNEAALTLRVRVCWITSSARCAALRSPSRSFVQLPLVGFYPPADVRVAKTKLSLPQNSPGDGRTERQREGGSGGTARRSQPASWKEASLVARSLFRSRDCNFRSFASVPPSLSVGRALRPSPLSNVQLRLPPQIAPHSFALAKKTRSSSGSTSKVCLITSPSARESCAGGSTHLDWGIHPPSPRAARPSVFSF